LLVKIYRVFRPTRRLN